MHSIFVPDSNELKNPLLDVVEAVVVGVQDVTGPATTQIITSDGTDMAVIACRP